MADYGTPNGDLHRGKPDPQNFWPLYNRSSDMNQFMEHPTRTGTALNKASLFCRVTGLRRLGPL